MERGNHDRWPRQGNYPDRYQSYRPNHGSRSPLSSRSRMGRESHQNGSDTNDDLRTSSTSQLPSRASPFASLATAKSGLADTAVKPFHAQHNYSDSSHPPLTRSETSTNMVSKSLQPSSRTEDPRLASRKVASSLTPSESTTPPLTGGLPVMSKPIDVPNTLLSPSLKSFLELLVKKVIVEDQLQNTRSFVQAHKLEEKTAQEVYPDNKVLHLQLAERRQKAEERITSLSQKLKILDGDQSALITSMPQLPNETLSGVSPAPSTSAIQHAAPPTQTDNTILMKRLEDLEERDRVRELELKRLSELVDPKARDRDLELLKEGYQTLVNDSEKRLVDQLHAVKRWTNDHFDGLDSKYAKTTDAQNHTPQLVHNPEASATLLVVKQELSDLKIISQRNDHSIQSLSARYNTVSTQGLYRSIVATLAPGLTQLAQLQKISTKLSDQVNRLEATASSLQNEFDIFKAKLAADSSSTNIKQDEIKQIQESVNQLQQTLNTPPLSNVPTELKETRGKLEALGIKVSNLEATHETSQNRYQLATSTNETLQRELDHLKDLHKQNETELQHKMKHIEGLCKDSETLVSSNKLEMLDLSDAMQEAESRLIKVDLMQDSMRSVNERLDSIEDYNKQNRLLSKGDVPHAFSRRGTLLGIPMVGPSTLELSRSIENIETVLGDLASCIFHNDQRFVMIKNLASVITEENLEHFLPDFSIRKLWIRGKKNTNGKKKTTRFALLQVESSEVQEMINKYDQKKWRGREIIVEEADLDIVEAVLLNEIEPEDTKPKSPSLRPIDVQPADAPGFAGFSQFNLDQDRDGVDDTVVINRRTQGASTNLSEWQKPGGQRTTNSSTPSLSTPVEVTIPRPGLKRGSTLLSPSDSSSVPPKKKRSKRK